MQLELGKDGVGVPDGDGVGVTGFVGVSVADTEGEGGDGVLMGVYEAEVKVMLTPLGLGLRVSVTEGLPGLGGGVDPGLLRSVT